MNYLLLSTIDNSGAGTAVLKTIESLRQKGHNAKLIVLCKFTESDASVGLLDYRTIKGKFLYWVMRIFAKLYTICLVGFPNPDYTFMSVNLNRISANKILELFGSTPDIIGVAWVPNFVNNKTIYELKQKTGAKVVYIMADNSPITGGCHYPWDCEGYKDRCYPCPALSHSNKRAYKTLCDKKKYITNDMIISAPTRDCNRAKSSYLFKDCIIVPNVTIRENPYKFEKTVGCSKWNIPDDNFVILCGAASIKSKRKGFNELMKAFSILKENTNIDKITIIIAGENCDILPNGYDVRLVGKLSFEELFIAYGAADLFVCPSIEDSGPMMINYGIMSYIPVVAFEMGFALDVIKHLKNGYVAKWRDVNDLAMGIKYCMERKFTREELEFINNRIMNDLRQNRSLLKYLGLE